MIINKRKQAKYLNNRKFKYKQKHFLRIWFHKEQNQVMGRRKRRCFTTRTFNPVHKIASTTSRQMLNLWGGYVHQKESIKYLPSQCRFIIYSNWWYICCNLKLWEQDCMNVWSFIKIMYCSPCFIKIASFSKWEGSCQCFNFLSLRNGIEDYLACALERANDSCMEVYCVLTLS